MAGPLLETKLYAPRRGAGLVSRPRLLGRLQERRKSKLVLVSAPAGFGKTTLLAEWLDLKVGPEAGRTTAWLSLDAGDSDPATFWTYVVAALRTGTPGIGAATLALLQEPRPPSVRLLLTTLINDLDAIAADTTVVLDDYHVIDSREVHEGVEFLLEHLPPGLQLVIVGRADPALPLARFRARGELVEIRAADLRFTPDEAAAYLNEAMGLRLTAQDVAALEARTEGWIAALQLAALSLEGRADAGGFIAGFAGDDRYVVDYLVEEVLRRQPANIQEFLLQTSVLDRMTGPLCDALTGQRDGKAMLEALDRANLFLVALDDRRQWYRYHRLFADVLQARLLDEQPDRVAALHRLAADWHESTGNTTEAVRHAMAGGDFPRAAGLVELAMPILRRDRREVTLRGWLELLPEQVLRVRPVLCNGLAGARLSTGTFEGVEQLLDSAARWLETPVEPPGEQTPPTDMVVVDHEELRRLPAGVAVHRSGLALVRGDVESTVSFARQALDLALEGDYLARGAASALCGLAAWSTGDLEVAHASYTVTLRMFERIGHVSDVLGCAITLADIQVAQGRLREAMRTYERALQLALSKDGAVLRGTVDMYVGIAALQRELDDLPAARRALQRSLELGEHTGLPQHPYRWRVVTAQVCEAEGDPSAALDLLDEAERVYVGDFSPNVRPVPALKARALLRRGRWEDAFGWVARRGLSVNDDLSYQLEYEHLTLARTLMARHLHERDDGDLDQAAGLLERLLQAAKDGHRPGSVIEIRVAQALAHQQRGDIAAARDSLHGGLVLAEPEGYVRTFVDEGGPMVTLLEEAAAQRIAPRYVRRLLAALDASPDEAPRPPAGLDLVEPLSSREREVLRLLGTELSGPEIARELVVSLNTVRSHTKSIYAKLGVNSRRSAVRRARAVDRSEESPG